MPAFTDRTISLKSFVAYADTGEGGVLLNMLSGKYCELNSTGSFLLKHFLAGATVCEAANMVSKVYDLTPAQAVLDVEDFLHLLATYGLTQQ